MHDWCVRLTSLTLICCRLNDRKENQINVARLQVTDCWRFCTNGFKCNNAKSSVKLQGQVHLLQIRSGLISVVDSKEQKREMGRPKRLFVQLKIISPWSRARREEEIQFSVFVYVCLSFFWMTFLPRTKNSENKRNQSVKSPLFEIWIKVCINKLLVCFLIHNYFVFWCIFLFAMFSCCIKVAGEDPGPWPLVTALCVCPFCTKV